MPGDYDIEYASPWAGANYMPFSARDTAAAQWDRDTWPDFKDLATNHLDAGVHFQGCRMVNRKIDMDKTYPFTGGKVDANPWWSKVFDDFRYLDPSELTEEQHSGVYFTSVCINTSIYLPWLVSQCLANGVVFKRSIFEHVSDAAAPGIHHSGHRADLVINCTGLSSLKLGGVEDTKLYPGRGQTVLVRNDAGCMYAQLGTDDGESEMMYIMTRAAGGGTVLGGCYQSNNWDSQPDPSLANRIMKRCVSACPKLTNGQGFEKLDVMRHAVGLRPCRNGGARLEKEKINGIWVVHNYGHAGAGYQSSYGCSKVVLKLVEEALQHQARL
ncbi:hypothetical protein BT93_L4533 [Corymbia citriodora subsp. variegata]|uniref:FAD dependent oxidoreductase domain-containing protein n=1 Tax=Corymbia citriodora subsp. variegata TaxID=360336 RepID=A0A8T0CFU3_CORYI|nr:hypothetical protein BT93_L4533 [Corymbia citriodora subsp. variegata]